MRCSRVVLMALALVACSFGGAALAQAPRSGAFTHEVRSIRKGREMGVVLMVLRSGDLVQKVPVAEIYSSAGQLSVGKRAQVVAGRLNVLRTSGASWVQRASVAKVKGLVLIAVPGKYPGVPRVPGNGEPSSYVITIDPMFAQEFGGTQAEVADMIRSRLSRIATVPGGRGMAAPPRPHERAVDLRLDGDAAASAGNLDDAVAAYQQSIEADPQYVAPRIRLGAVLGRQGRLIEAKDALSAALRMKGATPQQLKETAEMRRELMKTGRIAGPDE